MVLYGFVVSFEDIPIFYLYKDGVIEDGIALEIEDDVYKNISKDELIFVGSEIVLNTGKKYLDNIDVDVQNEIVYVFNPIRKYKLKSGLTIHDMFDLKLMEIYFENILDEYKKTLI